MHALAMAEEAEKNFVSENHFQLQWENNAVVTSKKEPNNLEKLKQSEH